MVTGRAQARARARPHPATRRPAVSRLAAGIGGLFIVFGVLGFLPGVTSDFGELGLAGHRSGAVLLGVFQVSVLLNVLHIGFGVLGLVLARSPAGSRLFLLGGGAGYLALWLYGALVDAQAPANVVPLNRADNWLHALVGAGMLALGALAGLVRPADPARPAGPNRAAEPVLAADRQPRGGQSHGRRIHRRRSRAERTRGGRRGTGPPRR
ncbi:DUF4383 domain-containing protein [Plantactinospora sp. KBS50]|uniref:DUF4383 domain-containing protein n=1 Tax=Plantactinospora sp. KBS50 TaxID=2024580 RepID=UPI000BAA9B52|nr:hypothetical protein CIK06_13705 [Plantactinospora sp. KBS50]